jgi:hypothetical protein
MRPEWNTELFKGDMDQVDELLAIIAAHKEIGVTGASVMFSSFKRRIQPIQQRHTLGFEYIGTEDPSRMCAEELTDDASLIRVKRVLQDVNAVPYVPELFFAQNPPKPVSVRLLWNKFCYSVTANRESSAGTHIAVPQPDIPRLDHLLPSAVAEAKKAQAADALPSDETIESGSPLTERAIEGKAKKNNSPRSSVELVEALPLVPRGRRLVPKHKACVVEPTRYGATVL